MKSAHIGSRYEVRAVTRSLDLLVELAGEPTGVGLSALARRCDLSVTTTFRLLESLRSRGFVRQHGHGNYSLGSRALIVGNAFLHTVSIWSHASDLAEQLASTSGETASVGVLDEDQVLYIAIAHGQRDIGVESAAGTRHPVHCTALGKAMLAQLPWPEVVAILNRRPPFRLTERTLVEIKALRADLARCRKRGYAVDAEERTPGVVCVGAPIRDHRDETVGAVSVSGAAFRMRERGIGDVGTAVMGFAKAASRDLGGSGETSPSPNGGNDTRH